VAAGAFEVHETWLAVKYAIPFNLFVVFYTFVLYGELTSWAVLPVGLLVLLVIDALYFRAQRSTRTAKPSFSLYACAAIFLIGALSAPFCFVKDNIPMWGLVACIIPGLLGFYCLRLALRPQRAGVNSNIP
jgi:hypothetical protein